MQDQFKFTPIETVAQPQIRDKVYEQLKRAILNGYMQPGERLIERKLAELLGVSRTPVREAIRVLELEGLVAHFPRVGVVVTQVSDIEVMEIYRIRAVLEGLCARMAAEKVKPQEVEQLTELLAKIEEYAKGSQMEKLEQTHQSFNDVIYRAADSQRLYSMIITLVEHINRYTRVGYSHPGRIEEANREHRQLLEAIKIGNGSLAESLAREHIENSRRAYFKKRNPKNITNEGNHSQ